MRGVRALWKAPLAVLFVLLTTCQFEFNLVQPSIELLNAQSAYQSGSNLVIDYIFTADESSLRCKYAVDKDTGTIQQGITNEFLPGTLQHLPITVDPDPAKAKGEYTVKLVAQARRGDEFVDLAFLAKTFEFYLDLDEPAEPEFVPASRLFNANASIELLHGEWTNSLGSPVRVFFSIGTIDPNETSIQYIVGSPIILELSEAPIEIRAIAVDDSGWYSAIKSEVYSFINIESCSSINTTALDEFVFPHGYGFSNISSVELMDWNGTTVYAVITNKTLTDITVAANLRPTEFLAPGDDNQFHGNGTATDGLLRLIDASGITDEIAIDLVP